MISFSLNRRRRRGSTLELIVSNISGETIFSPFEIDFLWSSITFPKYWSCFMDERNRCHSLMLWDFPRYQNQQNYKRHRDILSFREEIQRPILSISLAIGRNLQIEWKYDQILPEFEIKFVVPSCLKTKSLMLVIRFSASLANNKRSERAVIRGCDPDEK